MHTLETGTGANVERLAVDERSLGRHQHQLAFRAARLVPKGDAQPRIWR
jgi:hypothetical protein